MNDKADAVRLLRERAASYARDAEYTLQHGKGESKITDLAILTSMRDALRNVADELEAS